MTADTTTTDLLTQMDDQMEELRRAAFLALSDGMLKLLHDNLDPAAALKDAEQAVQSITAMLALAQSAGGANHG